MTQEQINTIISNFHCWYEDGSQKVGANGMVSRCAMAGYAIPTSLLIASVCNLTTEQTLNPNATFYRTWKDVTDKDRLDLMVDQLLHYASTYGTDYEGEPWCPNDSPVHLAFQDYIVITCVTKKEIIDLITRVLQSGIALDSDVVEAYCQFLIENGYTNPNGITNFEALCILSDHAGILPSDGPMATRILWYRLTGQSQIVQNFEDMLVSVKTSCTLGILRGLEEPQLHILAQSFYRYKAMWMAIRQVAEVVDAETKKKINRIRQLAHRNHKPMVTGFWEKFTSLEDVSEDTIKEQVAKLDNPFKIIKLLEMCMLRVKQNHSRSRRIFIIRNGKVWADENKFADIPGHLPMVTELLLERLVYGLSNYRQTINPAGHTAIRLPKDVELSVPSSAKSFYGNYPFGSYIPMKKKSFVGVYWENAWGTRDFDISYLDKHGNKVGWNSNYDQNGVTYSGDMTDARKGASEIIKFNKEVPDGVVFLNRYNGEPNSKYITFAGSGNEIEIDMNPGGEMGRGGKYMVKPDDIHLRAKGSSTKKQQIIGVINDAKLYMMTFDWNSSHVSGEEQSIIPSIMDKAASHLMLRDVLEAAGYLIEEDTEHYNQHKGKVTKVIDLSDIKMDSILQLIKF